MGKHKRERTNEARRLRFALRAVQRPIPRKDRPDDDLIGSDVLTEVAAALEPSEAP